ncbi:transposase [Candidatus Spongiihabitans sp.]|uniref:transposase n=1 Tax=Candidatus Spongiihabitans sp. TaxID=3101308 RepID=UPI003C7D957B
MMNKKNPALRDVTARRRQLAGMRGQEMNRLEKAGSSNRKASCERLITVFNDEIKRVDKERRAVLKADVALSGIAALHQSAAGVGLVQCGDFYHPLAGARQVQWQGVERPGGGAWSRDSGNHQGKRSIRGGREAVRRVLFMAAMSAVRHDRDRRRFHERLRKRGKPGKVALVAVMRKILLLVNAIAGRGTPWVENYTRAA